MTTILGYKNVYWDSQSAYGITAVNEKVYIQKMLVALCEYMKSDFDKFMFYFLFTHDSNVVPQSCTLKRKNKILFWFSDESGIAPANIAAGYHTVFKAYIKEESLNFYALPLGFVNELFEQPSEMPLKTLAVFFSGNLNNNRLRLYETLFFRKFKTLRLLRWTPERLLFRIFKKLKIKDLGSGISVFRFSQGFKSGLAYNNYFKLLAGSRFVLCPKGFSSTETFRHLEALQTGGIIISEPLPDVSIYKNHPFLIFSSYKELEEILDKIEKKGWDEEALRKAHCDYFENHFTLTAIASRIADISLRLLQ